MQLARHQLPADIDLIERDGLVNFNLSHSARVYAAICAYQPIEYLRSIMSHNSFTIGLWFGSVRGQGITPETYLSRLPALPPTTHKSKQSR